MAPWTGHRH